MPTQQHNLSGKPTLGRYTLLREVARSNDIVYEAIDPTINRRLAVKELNIAPTLTGQARRERIERFFREGRAAGAMNHPNIVTIFEVGEDNGRFFIAMEFLDGQSLRDRLHTTGALPLREAVSVTVSLCSALTYAHERGVVHRDIKPDNVHLVPTGGGTNTVKLTDFGIARILGEDSLTMAGQVFGTPSYMSPEQVTGNPLDGRTDQFSLGVLLYEMLTGGKPFTGDTVVTITYRILHEPMPAPAGVPPAVAQVLEQAMAKNAAQRFPSVAEFGSALLAAADGASLPHGVAVYPAPPVASPVQTVRFDPLAPPVPRAATTGGQATQAIPGPLPFGAVLASQPTGGVHSSKPRTNPAQNDAPRRQSNAGVIAVACFVLLAVIGGTGYALMRAFNVIQVSQTRESLVKLTQEGNALFEKKQYEEAAKRFKTVRDAGKTADSGTRLTAIANETTCYRTLGQTAQAKDDFPNALMWFTRAVEVSPLDPAAQSELAAVQKRLGIVAAAPGTQALPSASGIKPDNPLAGVIAASPAPGSGQTIATPTASPFAPDTKPGAQTTNDFAAANAARAARAAELLAQGDAAYSDRHQSEAVGLWREAVAAGPGSSGALTAQERIKQYGGE